MSNGSLDERASPHRGLVLDPLLEFTGQLRAAGFPPIPPDRIVTAAESLGQWSLAGESNPYWPLRLSLCSSLSEVAIFDQLFRGWSAPPAEFPVRTSVVAHRVEGAGAADAGNGVDDDVAGGGDADELSTRDFDDLTPAQLGEVMEWVALVQSLPTRPALRHRPGATTRLDPGATMRQMLRADGELVEPRYRRRVVSRRRVLLLVDVSASMRPYSDVLLRLGHALVRANPDHVEVFAIGTRFTRLTDALRAAEPSRALEAVGAIPTDWSMGTTLGSVLRDFLSRWGGTRAVRSAIAILGSDGFEFASNSKLVEQSARLALLAHTFIWADPAYRSPVDRQIDERVTQAQAHASKLLGCHNGRAIRALAEAIIDA